jgi:CBS domain-containing protein
MDARTLMTPRPIVATPGMTVREVARLMDTHDIGAIPVVDDPRAMRPVAIVTDRDLVIRCIAAGGTGDDPVDAYMTQGDLVEVRPEASVESVMNAMQRHQIRRLLVVDAGRLVGVVAQADLLLKEGPLAPVQVEAVLERISSPALVGI